MQTVRTFRKLGQGGVVVRKGHSTSYKTYKYPEVEVAGGQSGQPSEAWVWRRVNRTGKLLPRAGSSILAPNPAVLGSSTPHAHTDPPLASPRKWCKPGL